MMLQKLVGGPRELTYPTFGQGRLSSKLSILRGLVARRVRIIFGMYDHFMYVELREYDINTEYMIYYFHVDLLRGWTPSSSIFRCPQLPTSCSTWDSTCLKEHSPFEYEIDLQMQFCLFFWVAQCVYIYIHTFDATGRGSTARFLEVGNAFLLT